MDSGRRRILTNDLLSRLIRSAGKAIGSGNSLFHVCFSNFVDEVVSAGQVRAFFQGAMEHYRRPSRRACRIVGDRRVALIGSATSVKVIGLVKEMFYG